MRVLKLPALLAALLAICGIAVFAQPAAAQVNIIDAVKSKRTDLYLVDTDDKDVFHIVNLEKSALTPGAYDFDCEPISSSSRIANGCFGQIGTTAANVSGAIELTVTRLSYSHECTSKWDYTYTLSALVARNSWTFGITNKDCRLIDCPRYKTCQAVPGNNNTRIVIGRERAMAIAAAN